MEKADIHDDSESLKIYLILTVGIPGIGKSTFWNHLSNYLSTTPSAKVHHIEFDKIESSLTPTDSAESSSDYFSPEIWK